MRSNSPSRGKWWGKKLTGEDRAAALFARCEEISQAQEYRRAQEETHLRLYSESEWRGVYGMRGSAYNARVPSTGRAPKLSLNVVRSMINAATSMVCRSRPAVSFLSDGADWKLHTTARKRERFVQALFVSEDVHRRSHKVVKHAGILGTGHWQVIPDFATGRITLDVVGPGEVLVDDQEGIYGTPACIYRIRYADRETLAEQYPDHAEHIREQARGIGGYWRNDNGAQCAVITAWRVSCRDGEPDGLEVTTVSGRVLEERPYQWTTPRVLAFRWEEDPIGYYGTGIAAELAGLQFEINVLLRMIQANTYYGGNLKVFIERGAKVNVQQMTNDLRVPIIEYTGREPRFALNDVVSPQIIGHLQYLVSQAYSVTGISELNATSATPAASMSGRARLVHDNNESLRFKTTVERYEALYKELARAFLHAAEDLHEEHGDETVIFRDRSHLEQIKLSDVCGWEGSDIEAWSSSQMPHTLAGRIETADRLVASGYIDKRRALALLDIADVRAETQLAGAPYEVVDERIARILYDGEMIPPTPYMDLDYARQRAELEISRCEMRPGVDEQRLDMLREWRELCVDLLKRGEPPAPGPAGGIPAPETMGVAGAAAPVAGAVPTMAMPPVGMA